MVPPGKGEEGGKTDPGREKGCTVTSSLMKILWTPLLSVRVSIERVVWIALGAVKMTVPSLGLGMPLTNRWKAGSRETNELVTWADLEC